MMSGFVLGKVCVDAKFHVDNLSSAHVYLRLPEGMTWETIPQEILTDCAQLTKANSIEGGPISQFWVKIQVIRRKTSL
jgi:hypothetical protein